MIKKKNVYEYNKNNKTFNTNTITIYNFTLAGDG